MLPLTCVSVVVRWGELMRIILTLLLMISMKSSASLYAESQPYDCEQPEGLGSYCTVDYRLDVMEALGDRLDNKMPRVNGCYDVPIYITGGNPSMVFRWHDCTTRDMTPRIMLDEGIVPAILRSSTRKQVYTGNCKQEAISNGSWAWFLSPRVPCYVGPPASLNCNIMANDILINHGGVVASAVGYSSRVSRQVNIMCSGRASINVSLGNYNVTTNVPGLSSYLTLNGNQSDIHINYVRPVDIEVGSMMIWGNNQSLAGPFTATSVLRVNIL